MENATKALLIAAAVLIAILLITLGVNVFNTASEQMSGADLTEYEIQKFNDKFTAYNGDNKTGAEVNALVETVFNHNNAQTDNSLRVPVSGSVTLGINATSMAQKVSTGSRYAIRCFYDSTTGLVNAIVIGANGSYNNLSAPAGN